MEQQLLTVTQAARILDRSSDSVRRYEKEGILSAIRVGGHRLFYKAEVERLRDQREKLPIRNED